MRSESLNTMEGIRQGGSLSPLLFVIFMDEVIKETRKKTKATYIDYRNLKEVDISESMFIDDVKKR